MWTCRCSLSRRQGRSFPDTHCLFLINAHQSLHKKGSQTFSFVTHFRLIRNLEFIRSAIVWAFIIPSAWCLKHHHNLLMSCLWDWSPLGLDLKVGEVGYISLCMWDWYNRINVIGVRGKYKEKDIVFWLVCTVSKILRVQLGLRVAPCCGLVQTEGNKDLELI